MPKGGRRLGALIAAIAIAVSVAGCKDDSDDPEEDGPGNDRSSCPSTCEESKRCDGSPLADMDCDDYCGRVAAANEHAGCTALFDALLDCAEGVPDLCRGDGCASESKDYSDCFGIYCETHLEECAAIFG